MTLFFFNRSHIQVIRTSCISVLPHPSYQHHHDKKNDRTSEMLSEGQIVYQSLPWPSSKGWETLWNGPTFLGYLQIFKNPTFKIGGFLHCASGYGIRQLIAGLQPSCFNGCRWESSVQLLAASPCPISHPWPRAAPRCLQTQGRCWALPSTIPGASRALAWGVRHVLKEDFKPVAMLHALIPLHPSLKTTTKMRNNFKKQWETDQKAQLTWSLPPHGSPPQACTWVADEPRRWGSAKNYFVLHGLTHRGGKKKSQAITRGLPRSDAFAELSVGTLYSDNTWLRGSLWSLLSFWESILLLLLPSQEESPTMRPSSQLLSRLADDPCVSNISKSSGVRPRPAASWWEGRSELLLEPRWWHLPGLSTPSPASLPAAQQPHTTHCMPREPQLMSTRGRHAPLSPFSHIS